MLNTAGKMGKCLIGMNYALGDVPVTLKMRTGVKDGFPTAHKLMPKLHDWAVGSVTVCYLPFRRQRVDGLYRYTGDQDNRDTRV